MLTLRKSAERGHANHGWLDSYHTFSFANYYDPQHINFRSLRVINEDRIDPRMGFPTHPHRDMEILTYVIEGAVAHRDSLGNTEVVGAHGVQRFSAGTGITHSEFNPSHTDRLHLLQIWIIPDRQGIAPSYEQKQFSAAAKRQQWLKIASPDASDGSVKLHQNAVLYATILPPDQVRTYVLKCDRSAWVQVVRGNLQLNQTQIAAGDGVAISGERALLTLTALDGEAEVLLFDLA